MKNNHCHNHDGVYELSPITNRPLLVKPVTKRSYTFVTADSFFSIFLLLYQHSFRQFWPLAVFKDYFSCFRGLEKAGVSEKTSCGSMCLFADHRASRTSRTHDSSERRQHFISVPLTVDKRKHYAIHLSGYQWHFIQTGKVGNFRKHNERRLLN